MQKNRQTNTSKPYLRKPLGPVFLATKRIRRRAQTNFGSDNCSSAARMLEEHMNG